MVDVCIGAGGGGGGGGGGLLPYSLRVSSLCSMHFCFTLRRVRFNVMMVSSIFCDLGYQLIFSQDTQNTIPLQL